MISCGQEEPKIDKNGNTPKDLIGKYYEACNNDDYETIKALMTTGYAANEWKGSNGEPDGMESFKKNRAFWTHKSKSFGIRGTVCQLANLSGKYVSCPQNSSARIT